MSVLDRFGKVVRAEWGHRFGRRAASDAPVTTPPTDAERTPAPVRRRATVVDVEGALRVLELAGRPTLAEVRAAYQRLARRYYPKSAGTNADEAHAARVVLDALTDALELLEEHLLPLA